MDTQDNLPLTKSTFYILLSLAPGPKHGYAIMKDVKTLSESRVVLSTGTLYGAIKRLLDQGWILRVDEPAENGTGRERKAYLLTHRGRRILRQRLPAWASSTRLRNSASLARKREPSCLSFLFMPTCFAYIPAISRTSLPQRCSPSS